MPSFVSILKQITEHRLPRDYDYHRIPAPWIQIRLLRIMAILGAADQVYIDLVYHAATPTPRHTTTTSNYRHHRRRRHHRPFRKACTRFLSMSCAVPTQASTLVMVG